MAVLLDADSRIIVQGITGREGRLHTERMLAAGARVVGGTNPEKAGETVALGGEDLPVYATVADARFAKPLDIELILNLARNHEALITVEEGAMGGFGSFVLQALAQHGALDRGLKVRTLTLPDIFQDQDKPEAMYAQAGLDAEGIVAGALSALGVDNVSAAGRRA